MTFIDGSQVSDRFPLWYLFYNAAILDKCQIDVKYPVNCNDVNLRKVHRNLPFELHSEKTSLRVDTVQPAS